MTDAQRTALMLIASDGGPHIGPGGVHGRTAAALEARGLVTIRRHYGAPATIEITDSGRAALEAAT